MLRGWLPKHLEANDDLTLEEEHRQAFEEEFGQNVSTSTIGRAIADLPDGGWPLKKSRRDSLRARRAEAGIMAVARIPLGRQAPRVRGREWLSHLHETPERARAPRGKRASRGRSRGTVARTPP
jgi:hypothetical protein